jgi:protoheme IX farnesyltransferase
MMAIDTVTPTPAPKAASLASAGDYLTLMKPRVMSLVVFTAAAGLIAAPADMNIALAICAVFAVAMGSGAAGALNMWYDADIDAVMTRTATRPVPSGRVPAAEALALGLICSALSVVLMFLASNLLAAGLLAFSIFFYAVVYTMWLKRSTPQNIVIGGAAGAFPPVIGWAAATGSVPLDAWLLFALIFMWTPPHFWALSLNANSDYARAGVPMLPVVKGAKETRRQILLYSLVMAPLGLAPVASGLGGYAYAFVAGLGGLVFLALAVRVFFSRAGEGDAAPADRKAATGLFAYSIFYLFALFGALIVERVLGLGPVLAGGVS